MDDKKLIRERKKIAERLGYIPECIMTNVPVSFLSENGITTEAYVRWYLGMNSDPERMFYHFISTVPKFEILYVYLCFDGRVQLKARVGQFLKGHALTLPNVSGGVTEYEKRNWMVTCGPVVKAPHEITQKGFQGFRYCQDLW
jgi:hypothetical protein